MEKDAGNEFELVQADDEEDPSEEKSKSREEQGFWARLVDQVKASIMRRLLFYKRKPKELVFELFVPTLMVLIGLSLTSLIFIEEQHSKPLQPDAYLWKQRILVN